MKILIASDHAGFELKNHLVWFLNAQGFEVEDCGPHEYNETDDYPDLIAPVARRVSEEWRMQEGGGEAAAPTLAIILGGSGQGEAIVVNRFAGMRAIVYYGGNSEIVALGRKHNDANVLSLGARFVTKQEAEQACLLFLQTGFEGGRHEKRIKKIDNL